MLTNETNIHVFLLLISFYIYLKIGIMINRTSAKCSPTKYRRLKRPRPDVMGILQFENICILGKYPVHR